MVKRTIIWTETAAKQRRLILQYWTTRNKSSVFAKKLISLIADQLQIISDNPLIFKQTEIESIRESAMGHFSLYYTFNAEQIIVMALWDNRQDPEKLLSDLNNEI
jgi:plasmid stabilization system protein ParE